MNDVDICNMALANIGQPPIMSLSSLPQRSTPAEKVCKQRYVEARQETMRKALWNFASTWRAGEQVANLTPKRPWQYVYSYPSDALRVFEIQRDTVDQKIIPFEVADGPNGEGQVILCDHPAPIFVYVRDKLDPTKYDADFIQAMSWCLAAKIAMPLTKSVKLRDGALQMFINMTAVAVTNDENEGYQQTDIDAGYQAARN
jgi:hypothetical protein